MIDSRTGFSPDITFPEKSSFADFEFSSGNED